MAVPTEKEQAMIRQFRARVCDAVPDEYNGRDENLLRWIRAREHDLEKAEQMFRNSMKWRMENNVDNIINSLPPANMAEQFPYQVDGFDREGQPVLTLALGQWDVRRLVEEEGQEGIDGFIHYTNVMLERIGAAIKNAKKGPDGRPITQFSCVCDMDGFAFKQLANMKAVGGILQMVSTYEAHYPETVCRSYMINAPTVFSVLYGMMKPLMAARTIEKMKIFGPERSDWEKEVVEVIAPDQIEYRYGGNKIH